MKRFVSVFMVIILAACTCLSSPILAAHEDEDEFSWYRSSAYPSSPTRSNYQYRTVELYTPGGIKFNAREYIDDLSDEDKTKALENDDYYISHYSPSTKLLYEPTLRFNCYSYAMYNRDYQSNTYYIASTSYTSGEDVSYESLFMNQSFLHNYWIDPHFVQVPRENGEAKVGDVVFYYYNHATGQIAHAGVVSEVQNGNATRVISKWGSSGLYDHPINDVPRDYRQQGVGGHNADGKVIYEIYSYVPDHSYTKYEDANQTNHTIHCKFEGCPSSKTEPHNFTIADNNASTHTKTCKNCGRKVNVSHEFTAWDYNNASTHVKTCRYCGRRVTEEHAYGNWQNINSETHHQGTCRTCDHEHLFSHNFGNWTSISDTQHRKTCDNCKYAITSPHSFPATWVSAGVSGHKKTCSSCDKVILEKHKYSGTKCTVCGYTGPGVAPTIVPQKREIFGSDNTAKQ